MNLIALPSRLVSTCRIRAGSNERSRNRRHDSAMSETPFWRPAPESYRCFRHDEDGIGELPAHREHPGLDARDIDEIPD